MKRNNDWMTSLQNRYCTNCGRYAPDFAVFCTKCGIRIQEDKNLNQTTSQKPSAESMREVKEEWIRRNSPPLKVHTPKSPVKPTLQPIARKNRAKRSSPTINVWVIAFILFACYSMYDYVATSRQPIPDRLLAKVTSDSTGPHKFLTYKSKLAIEPRWDPCQVIELVVNPSDEPSTARDSLIAALNQIQSATGLKFKIVGETTERYVPNRQVYLPDLYPNSANGWAPVLVDWEWEEQFRELAKSDGLDEEAIGFAGANYMYRSDSDTSTGSLVSGTVTLDATWAKSELNAGNYGIVRAVIMHELGHLVGLDHVEDDAQIMASGGNATKWGDGDREGLAYLGSAQCAKERQRPQPRPANWE